MVDVYRRLAELYLSLGLIAKVLVVLVFALITTAFGIALVVWLPADHFSRLPAGDAGWRKDPVLRWSVLILKNALGVVLLPVGVVMVIPGVPGPGLVFILLGVSLLDFPGKRRLERRLLAVPSVLRFLNSVRKRFNRPPLLIDREAG